MLYACMAVAPLAGYLGSNFQHARRSLLRPRSRAVGLRIGRRRTRSLLGLHDVSTYLLLALIVGHVAMALEHALIERDGIFARIAP